LIGFGCDLLGTLKRSALSPFHYGDAKYYSYQERISERGPRVTYFKQKVLTRHVNGRSVVSYVGAHRNGSGGCFLTHCTNAHFGPGNWSYIPKNIALPDCCFNFQGPFLSLTQKCLLLTALQRSADWFLLRLFRFTSTGAVVLLRAICNSTNFATMFGLPSFPQNMLNILGLRSSTRVTLRRVCTQRGVPEMKVAICCNDSHRRNCNNSVKTAVCMCLGPRANLRHDS
jgi:hypothetical protein